MRSFYALPVTPINTRIKPGKFRAAHIGLTNIVRSPVRSLSVVALLSIGIFMVVSVSLNKSAYIKDTSIRSSGTGGFSLFCKSTYPIDNNLNFSPGRKTAGLNNQFYDKVKFVQMRLRIGDDASCLNPNRIFSPQILGVDPE